MNLKARKVTSILGAVGVAIVLSLVATNPADATPNASPVVPPTPAISAAAQASYEAQVANFVRASPAPTNVPGSAPAVYAKYKAAMVDYWSKVPWNAVYGQWGCTVTSVEQRMQTSGDGDVAPTVGIVAACPKGGTTQEQAGAIEPRTATIAASAPLAAASTSQCNILASLNRCLGSDRLGDIYARTWNYDFSATTLTVRLGNPPTFGTCTQGNFKASVGPSNVPASGSLTVHSTTNVNTYWSNTTTNYATVVWCATI